MVLLAWNLFLKYDSHYILHETYQIWIYSDSHESNNLHVYMMGIIQRRLKINVTYISIPPYYGHNICNGYFARGTQKLRSVVVNSGVKSISEVISAIKQVATTVHIVDYEKEVENLTKKN